MLRQILSENPDASCMRLMALLSLVIGGAIAFIGLYRGTDITGLSLLCGVFVGSAFGGKVWQKSVEARGAGPWKPATKSKQQ